MKFHEVAISMILCLLIGAAYGAYFSYLTTKEASEKQAIQHGCAQFHPETGKFTWRNNGTEQ